MMIPNFKKSRGFSLIEVMIAVVLFGIVAGTLIHEYSRWLHHKRQQETSTREQIVRDALARYIFSYHALPCPAGPRLNAIAPMAGIADCSMAQGQTEPAAGDPPQQDPVSGIYLAPGARQTPANPQYNPSDNTIRDPVLVGTLPYITLGMSMEDATDGWGNRMTYAMSYYLSNAKTFSDQGGAINVEHFDPDPAVDSIVPMTNGDVTPPIADAFMFAVVSHGPNGRGAWNNNGKQPVPCDLRPIDMGLAAPTRKSTGRDNENCNGDATFLYSASGPHAGGEDIYSTRRGPDFYDDAFVLMNVTVNTGAWRAYSSRMNKIESPAGENVGIGTTMPTAKLDVFGNIKARSVQSDTYCDATTGHCYPQSLISPGEGCNGGMMIGVANGAPVCAQMFGMGRVPPAACPSGTFVIGVNAQGRMLCARP